MSKDILLYGVTFECKKLFEARKNALDGSLAITLGLIGEQGRDVHLIYHLAIAAHEHWSHVMFNIVEQHGKTPEVVEEFRKLLQRQIDEFEDFIAKNVDGFKGLKIRPQVENN